MRDWRRRTSWASSSSGSRSFPESPLIADLSDAEADDVQRRIEAAGLEHMKVSAGSPFKFLDLTEVTDDTLEDHEEFKADFRARWSARWS